ncbi:hypothetical protein Gogos_006949 [Gossypium gossypioides]|uniref:Uncharacterized protein n=1 Tax=Gossypium gossypioides TaxID=34282 RepID=A0A7J9C7B9_GOSGO|nr:hypothetical protein [Gossypium gossypioides]
MSDIPVTVSKPTIQPPIGPQARIVPNHTCHIIDLEFSTLVLCKQLFWIRAESVLDEIILSWNAILSCSDFKVSASSWSTRLKGYSFLVCIIAERFLFHYILQ